MVSHNQKKSGTDKSKRVLITVNVPRSAGPLRFVVCENELVADVIDMALKSYAREGRLPVLGTDLEDFLLYCPAAGSDAVMNPWETIGAWGHRNFLLCKKPQPAGDSSSAAGAKDDQRLLITDKGSWRWRVWVNMPFSFAVASN